MTARRLILSATFGVAMSVGATATASAALFQTAPSGPTGAQAAAIPAAAAQPTPAAPPAMGPGYAVTKMATYARAAPGPDGHVVWEVTGQTLVKIAGCNGGWCAVIEPRAMVSYIAENVLDPVAGP